MSSKNVFHDFTQQAVVNTALGQWRYTHDTRFTYTFENFFHPFVTELTERLTTTSLSGMLDPAFHAGLTKEFFDSYYTELTSAVVGVGHEPERIDLSPGGSYSGYNWELLFHVPLTIAVHLSKNQRFAEARKWFHHVFDPTCTDTSVPVPQRFWRFLAFRDAGAARQIDEQLAVLSKPVDECTPAELALKQQILTGYEAIRAKPFQPHAVARTRQVAYQYCVVMKYLDNLIAWGDSLFRQDTLESVNEATQLYVLAANLLGARPERAPSAGSVRPMTYADLRKRGLDAMGNALVELEGKFPLNLGVPKTGGGDGDAAGPLFGIGRTLYFCVPRNDKLLGYWDTVADRLFKIRHCMTLDGTVRQLALFDPPLDPGMLVKAAAAGLDLGSVVNGLNQPVSPVRAPVLIAKALELCAEVRSLGHTLLAALEKSDAETLAATWQRHEVAIHRMQQDVRFLHWTSAQETTRSLVTSRGAALERLAYYQRALGLPADPGAPADLPLDFEKVDLTEEGFAGAYAALVGQYDLPVTVQPLPPLPTSEDDDPSAQSGAAGVGKLHLTDHESGELNSHLPTARDTGLTAGAANAIASGLAPVPDSDVDIHFWGIGGKVKLNIGTALVAAARIGGDIAGITAAWERDQAGMAARTAGYERRTDEWLLHHNLAAHELKQIGKQILTSLIGEQLAHRDYLTTKQQIADGEEIEQFLKDKFTSAELYGWLQGEASRLFYEYYRFAYDTLRKAEAAVKRDLMRPEVDAQDFVKFNYWDAGRKGLLSGEALYLDAKRLEAAYLDNNKRDLELVRHVSLRQLAPAALLTLKATGSCQVTVPEWVFDLDTPGHYLRRIKTVGLTIPCVTGPYAGPRCTLTLTKSTLRTSPLTGDGYARQGSDDGRFTDYFSAAGSIVTSSGQNDNGLFEVNLRDERLLPFEGAGAESTWTLELPKEFRQFDYATISDVVLHIRYQARDGGAQLRTAATDNLKELAADSGASGWAQLLGLRADFPGEWAAFLGGTGAFTAKLRRDHFPYHTHGMPITITGIELYRVDATGTPKHHAVTAGTDLAALSTALNDTGTATLDLPPDAPGPATVLTRTAGADVWLVLRYALG